MLLGIAGLRFVLLHTAVWALRSELRAPTPQLQRATATGEQAYLRTAYCGAERGGTFTVRSRISYLASGQRVLHLRYMIECLLVSVGTCRYAA